MTNMAQDHLSVVAQQVREEAAGDYVGVWEVHRLLQDRGNSSPERIAQVVELLLHDDRIEIGQFTDGVFRAWTGEKGTRLIRLQRELEALGRAPDIGEVAWLVQR